MARFSFSLSLLHDCHDDVDGAGGNFLAPGVDVSGGKGFADGGTVDVGDVDDFLGGDIFFFKDETDVFATTPDEGLRRVSRGVEDSVCPFFVIHFICNIDNSCVENVGGEECCADHFVTLSKGERTVDITLRLSVANGDSGVSVNFHHALNHEEMTFMEWLEATRKNACCHNTKSKILAFILPHADGNVNGWESEVITERGTSILERVFVPRLSAAMWER